MTVKRQQKGARMENTKKLLLDMPEDVHHRLRIYAVTERKTMSEAVTELVAEALARKGQKS
jgi:macrodomain Ter protein organizer (MatP/YcbG family)